MLGTMNTKNIDEKFEHILENPTESDSSDAGIDKMELEATLGLDGLLKKAIPANPLPSSKLDDFLPYKEKRSISLPPFHLLWF